MRRRPTKREMQRAFAARDAAYDGLFVVGVRTTGIFCLPSCPARRPRPEHVEFFGAADEALRAGYRPCQRCRPLHPGGPPAWVTPLLEHLRHQPNGRLRDDDLRALGLPPSRVRRYFKECHGMTFQAYQRAMRMGAALAEMGTGADLTRVALDHGYSSNSGFRTAFERVFGGPPGRHRAADCVFTQVLASPLGRLLAAADSAGLRALSFVQERALDQELAAWRRQLGPGVVPGSHPTLAQLRDELSQYFAGERRTFDVPLAYDGTPFQRAVWDALRRIPYGQTLSYAELAQRIGRPGAQRAVGMANHYNPIAIVIPCHRVVNRDGRLGGYGGGLWRKQFLLDLEQQPAAAGGAAVTGQG